jgi:hypothetical protein
MRGLYSNCIISSRMRRGCEIENGCGATVTTSILFALARLGATFFT